MIRYKKKLAEEQIILDVEYDKLELYFMKKIENFLFLILILDEEFIKV